MLFQANQDQLVSYAQLCLSPAHVVFQQLKANAERPDIELYSYDHHTIEPELIKRSEPLIDLALACFGANAAVFRTLYNHSLSSSDDEPGRPAAAPGVYWDGVCPY